MDIQTKEQAKIIFSDGFRVRFNFDGNITTDQNVGSEKRRAVGFDADKSTFTWKRFISLEDSYNPSPGKLNPWSLKHWYKWGCRNFHFHNPFGKVSQGNTQELVYEIDQFLNAKNGLIINGVVQNTPMPWLTNDFVDVIKALTTGQRGNLDQLTWDSWTTGADAWFNPDEPIDLIVYIGAMANPGSDAGYQTYVNRWNTLFTTSATSAAKRLRDSVAPFIQANCKIAFDAAVASPGEVAGQTIPFTIQNNALQKGWWTFFTWAVKTIGKEKIFVESYPFKTNGLNNSYLGYNIISDDDWSYSSYVQQGPNGPHMTSEMGNIQFLRSLWQNTSATTPLIAKIDQSGIIKERYWFLKDSQYASVNQNEIRLNPSTCCQSGHNYYYHTIYPEIIAYHLLEKQHTRMELDIRKNTTRSGILVPNSLLQILPEAFPQDSNWQLQFGNRFKTSIDFINYLSDKIDMNKSLDSILYNSR